MLATTIQFESGLETKKQIHIEYGILGYTYFWLLKHCALQRKHRAQGRAAYREPYLTVPQGKQASRTHCCPPQSNPSSQSLQPCWYPSHRFHHSASACTPPSAFLTSSTCFLRLTPWVLAFRSQFIWYFWLLQKCNIAVEADTAWTIVHLTSSNKSDRQGMPCL